MAAKKSAPTPPAEHSARAPEPSLRWLKRIVREVWTSKAFQAFLAEALRAKPFCRRPPRRLVGWGVRDSRGRYATRAGRWVRRQVVMMEGRPLRGTSRDVRGYGGKVVLVVRTRCHEHRCRPFPTKMCR